MENDKVILLERIIKMQADQIDRYDEYIKTLLQNIKQSKSCNEKNDSILKGYIFEVIDDNFNKLENVIMYLDKSDKLYNLFSILLTSPIRICIYNKDIVSYINFENIIVTEPLLEFSKTVSEYIFDLIKPIFTLSNDDKDSKRMEVLMDLKLNKFANSIKKCIM